jgi:cytochrome c
MKRLMLILCVAGIAGAATGASPSSASVDVERGRKVFAVCAACHREPAAELPNPGPDLRGVLDRPAGTVPGFRYSRALRNAKRTWSEGALDAFIADPQLAVPGNTMPFPGLPDEAQRRELIAYLKTLK